MSKNKKIIVIASTVALLCLGLIVGGLFMFLNSESDTTNTPDESVVREESQTSETPTPSPSKTEDNQNIESIDRLESQIQQEVNNLEELEESLFEIENLVEGL